MCVCSAEAAGYVDVSLSIPLLLSLAVTLALVVLLLNCASCCKEQEINFKVSQWLRLRGQQYSYFSTIKTTLVKSRPCKQNFDDLNPAKVIYVVKTNHIKISIIKY